ncbi:DUF6152 family protein [Paracidovorax avenae]|uniref:DUF6152 family protein n=1 Tax=Paracidovorax avenae TaxID=80867 RepID=UPI000D22067F|nr:DUF6152 family protein [Paracidovorax avenae]AVT12537.1 hypothetical protein C8235_06320 [Paracidovorax avenae]
MNPSSPPPPRRRCLLLAAACSALPTLAFAHHSFALFDESKTTTIKGVVGRFAWANPHVTIYIDTPAPSAKQFKIETGSVNALRRMGWKADSMKAGDSAEVSFHPLKNGEPGGLLVEIKVGGAVLTGGG